MLHADSQITCHTTPCRPTSSPAQWHLRKTKNPPNLLLSNRTLIHVEKSKPVSGWFLTPKKIKDSPTQRGREGCVCVYLNHFFLRWISFERCWVSLSGGIWSLLLLCPLSYVIWHVLSSDMYCQTVHCHLLCSAKLSTVIWHVLPNCPPSSDVYCQTVHCHLMCSAKVPTVMWLALPNCQLLSDVYCHSVWYLYHTGWVSDRPGIWQAGYLSGWVSYRMGIWQAGYLTGWVSDRLGICRYLVAHSACCTHLSCASLPEHLTYCLSVVVHVSAQIY